MGKLSAQAIELIRVTANGTRDYEVVRSVLQTLIEGTNVALPHGPSWYRSPDQQLERARQLWPHKHLPSPPSSFKPRTETEVLLHVPDALDALWGMVLRLGVVECSFPTIEEFVRSTERQLEGSIVKWVAFDPEYYLGNVDLTYVDNAEVIAGHEVLSAMIQFPEWMLTWSQNGTSPLLGGYLMVGDYSWPHVPYFIVEDDKLLVRSAERGDRTQLVVPTVREL